MKRFFKKCKKQIIAAFILTVCAAVFVPFFTTPYEKECIAKVENQDKMIALTFDDGPGNCTMQLLDGLEQESVRVSFFLLGKKISANEEAVLKMQADGHLIGNHTYTHRTLFNTTVNDYIAELEETDVELKRVTGSESVFFRPPHGYYIGAQLSKIDKVAVLWSDDPADWKHMDADYVYEYLIEHAGDGKIFLLHDTRETTVEGVLRAIPELKEQGYSFVRVDELLCRNGDGIAPGLAYRGCKNGKSPVYF